MRKRTVIFVLALAVCLGGCARKSAETAPLPSPPPSATATPAPPPSATATPSPTVPVIFEGFLSFLAGDAEAVVDEDFYDDLQYLCDGVFADVERFDLPALTRLVADDYADAADPVETEVSYALLETSGGREMLAVRCFCPVGVEAFRGDFIFGLYDGEVRLTYARDSWSRSDTWLCKGLVFDGEGSGGAGDHFNWLGYIDESGHYRRVYDLEILYGEFVAMHASEVFGFEMDWAADCICDILTTEEGEFYALEAGQGTDEQKLERFRTYMEEDEGRQEVPEVDTMIADLKEAHGLGEAVLFDDWLPWPPEG